MQPNLSYLTKMIYSIVEGTGNYTLYNNPLLRLKQNISLTIREQQSISIFIFIASIAGELSSAILNFNHFKSRINSYM